MSAAECAYNYALVCKSLRKLNVTFACREHPLNLQKKDDFIKKKKDDLLRRKKMILLRKKEMILLRKKKMILLRRKKMILLRRKKKTNDNR